MALRRWLGVALAALAGLGLWGCGRKDEPAPGKGIAPGETLPAPSDPFATLPSVTSGDIAQKLEDAREFGKFLHALTKSEALYDIKGAGPHTVLAPTDAAFEDLPEETAKALNRDLKWYRRVLLHHVLAGRATAEDLAKAGSVETMAGVKLPVYAGSAGNITVGAAHLEMKDIQASNGLIHSIDKVLLLPQE